MTNMSPEEIQDIINERDREVNIVKDDFKFITECSETAEFMETEKIDRVKAISKKTYVFDEKITPYLTPDETENLCIIRGNLTDQERKIIENHSIMTYKMLEPLPFPKHLLNVPKYASGHHEKVNGSGYPLGEISPELSYQARIMAVADIFEALTAQDRPYRGPMKLSKAIDILRSMKDNGHIDPDIFELFISSGIYLEYAHKVLNPEQIDID